MVVSEAHEESWGTLSEECRGEEPEQSRDSSQENMFVPLSKGRPPLSVALICHQTPSPSLTVPCPQIERPSEPFLSQASEGSSGG